MRINKVDNVFQVYNKNAGVKKATPGTKTKASDELKISEKALDFQFALQKLKEVGDIRFEKTEKIKNQVKTGTYNVSNEKIAEKIMQTNDFDKRI